MLLSSRIRAHTHDYSIAPTVGALCVEHTLVAQTKITGIIYAQSPSFRVGAAMNRVELLLVLSITAVEYHISQARHFPQL